MKKFFRKVADSISEELFCMFMMISIALCVNILVQDNFVRLKCLSTCNYVLVAWCLFRIVQLEQQVKELMKRGG